MFIPVEITANNFQSFESLTYKFQQGKSVLIQGENLSDEGQESNGSGKSTLQEIIYYCLMGSSSTGKRDFKLIRRGETESNISVTFYNSIDKRYLKIERDLFLKKSSLLRIFINDEEQKHLYSTVDDGNKLIFKFLDVSPEDIKNFYLVSREKFTPFFKLSDTQSRELVSRFSNISFLPSVEVIIDTEIKDEELNLSLLEEGLREVETSITSYSAKIEALDQQVTTIKENSSPEKVKMVKESAIAQIKLEISSFEKEIEHYKELDKILDKSIKEQTDLKMGYENIEKCIQRTIERLNKINYTELKQKKLEATRERDLQITKLKGERSPKLKEIESFKKESAALEIILSGVITCPKCSHNFIQNDELSVSEAELLIKEIEKEVTTLNTSVEKIDEQIKQIEEQILVIEKEIEGVTKQQLKKNRVISRLENELKLYSAVSINKKIASYEQDKVKNSSEITITTTKIKQKLQEIKGIQEQKTDNTLILSNLKDSIDKNKEFLINKESEKKSIIEDISAQQEVIENRRTWLLYFKQFYIYLTNQCLKTIQDLCNKFLEQIDTDLRVQVDGFKYLADNSVKEKVTVTIVRGNVVEDDYRSFSGGERGKLILSTILSFQELINNSSKTGGLDLLFIDEVLDAVDGLGMKSFVQALNNLHKTIHLTTHISVKDRDENVLLIRKINDKSYIV